MFCPECKAEYQPGFIRCSDCDVELVDHLEAPEVAGSDDNVVVATATGPFSGDEVVVATAKGPFEDAQICSFLEANGIPARIRSQMTRTTHSIGILPVQILVPREFALAARDLLARADHGDLEIEE